jgi:hypothetical protein
MMKSLATALAGIMFVMGFSLVNAPKVEAESKRSKMNFENSSKSAPSQYR